MGTYTYSRTFSTSEMVRLTCDGFRGDYQSITWNNTGYTGSGDSSALISYSTVTITMQKVTATWFNNAGGCSYNFYAVLYTPYGNFTSPTVNYAWPAGGGTNTISFEITDVVGDWTYFEIWGQNWTMSEKKTEYPYVYWFNNSAGTVTVSYTATSDPVSILSKLATPYVWTTTRTKIQQPAAAMKALSSQSCVASASSTYSSSYPVWRCFDYSGTSNAWASSSSATGPWVKLQMQYPLYDISLTIINRNDRGDNIRGPIAGYIEGSNDDSTYDILYTFSGRDGATRNAATEYECGNYSKSYKYIRVRMSDWYPSGNHTYCAIGEIYIYGYRYPSTGHWEPATAYVCSSSGSYVATTQTYIMQSTI